jgi:cell division protein ZapE
MSSVSALYQQRVATGKLTADPAQERVLPLLDDLVADLSERAPAKSNGGGWRRLFTGGQTEAGVPDGQSGIYLWGGVGRGKSMLLDLCIEAAPITAKRRVHFHEFMQEVQAGLEAARKRGDQDTVRPVARQIASEVRLLCFDEMQITDIADAMIVGRLFQTLFEEGVVIVTTSNRAPVDLYKHGLNRQLFLPFIKLVQEKMQVVELVSPTDYRQGRTAGGQVWFVPADAEAHRSLDAIWDELTDGASPKPLEIEVRGRKLILPAFAQGVGRAGFWDLCGKPLGPADYLELVRTVKVLMIDSIPRLGLSNYNEAKRFVTLIDTVYEARIRLIASAADEPEQLYNEGEGSFEFERTASRLREMQDAAWGAPAAD